MKVLVACEESQEVTAAFIALGHDAMSCDIAYPGAKGLPHYQGDVRDLLDDYWDLIIAHPVCTFLTVANTHLKRGCSKYTPEQAIVLQKEAIDFFMLLMNSKIKRKALENPIGIMSTRYRKPDQIIRPFWFGENSTKATCLWLENLPPLKKTNEITPTRYTTSRGTSYDSWWYQSSLIHNLEERSRFRSKTFPGIARAMAEQWGGDIR